MMPLAGESSIWVAQQVADTDWGMIRKTYGKFMPDAIPDAGDKAVGIYAPNGKIIPGPSDLKRS